MKKYDIFEKMICETVKSCYTKGLGFIKTSSHLEPILKGSPKKDCCRSLSLGWV